MVGWECVMEVVMSGFGFDELGLRPLRTYFTTSSKEGCASLSVEHPWSFESLWLPVFPSNAIPECLPLLDPAFAHYVGQWEKFMVPDPTDTDAVGFYLPTSSLPEHIAPLENLEALAEIAWAHTPEDWKWVLGYKRPFVLVHMEPFVSNIDEYVVAADELGIVLWAEKL